MRDMEFSRGKGVPAQDKSPSKLNPTSVIIDPVSSSESKSRILSLPSISINPPKLDNSGVIMNGNDATQKFCGELKLKVRT
jgi:hypothetical protein